MPILKHSKLRWHMFVRMRTFGLPNIVAAQALQAILIVKSLFVVGVGEVCAFFQFVRRRNAVKGRTTLGAAMVVVASVLVEALVLIIIRLFMQVAMVFKESYSLNGID